LNAFAATTIELNSASIVIPENILKENITLVRTVNTPAEVDLVIPSHAAQECVKKEIKSIHGEHSSCGSYTVPRCENESYDCETRTRCTMWVGSGPTCAWEEFYQYCQNRIRCTDETRYMSCYHDAEVCVEYKSVPQEASKAKLVFDLKRRQARNTHKLDLSLTPYNGVNIRSNDLSVQYRFDGSYLIRK
jgi:hypothetical protein